MLTELTDEVRTHNRRLDKHLTLHRYFNRACATVITVITTVKEAF
jgi:hypothetical protein